MDDQASGGPSCYGGPNWAAWRKAPSDGDTNKHIGGQGHPRGRKDLPEMCSVLCGNPEAHTPPGTGQAGVHTETAPPV